MSESAGYFDGSQVDGNDDSAKEQKSANDEKYLIFSILGRLYTFPSRIIGEIALFDTVYPIPLVPSYVLGVINRYSVPYALFDVGLLLFNTPSPRGKVLVLKDEIDRLAFLIDDVSGITDVPQEKLVKTDSGTNLDDVTESISATFNWKGSDVLVLDVQRIITRISAEVA